MSFGLVQLGMAAAHLGDAKMANDMLEAMLKGNYYSTYAPSHDAGPEVFGTDIAGGVPALML